MTTHVDPDLEAAPPARAGGWPRVLVTLGGALAMFLFGATAGLLIGLPGSSTPAVPAADSVDVGFAQDMSVHHMQAVTMASLERDRATDPVLQGLAFDIESTQRSQIGRMQGWLSLWGAAALPIGGHMAWMGPGPGHEHGGADPAAGGVARMPGMATDEELTALRAASGDERDVLFLQLMLRHHEGGVGMLRYGAENATVPQVRNLAAQMLSAQSSESEYLRSLLAERGGTPLPL